MRPTALLPLGGAVTLRPERMATPQPVAKDPLVGTILSDRYRIDALIGEGGMGLVYRGEHVLMHKKVAIKVLHPELTRNAEIVQRFEREATAAANVDHPNVVAATDFGKTTDGSFFLVMEYIEGRRLAEVLAASRRMAPRRAVHLARQIARALARAHAVGIVHRDLKPDNVMILDREGDPDFVKVLDFGIARIAMGEGGPQSQPLTQVGMVYGTPEYIAPEQAMGQPVDARADLYALGVILFEMLTGRRPYDSANKVELLGLHVTAPVPSARSISPGVPVALDLVVSRLMQKTAEARFASAAELIAALDHADARGSSQAPAGALIVGAALKVAHVAREAARKSRPTLARVHRTLPPALQRLSMRALLVAAALGLIFFVAAGWVLWPAAPPERRPAPVRSASLDEELRAFQATDRVRTAFGQIAAGRAGAGIAALEAVRAENPANAHVRYLLGTVYHARGRFAEALGRYGEALGGDGRYADDPKLLSDVLAALAHRETSDAAIGLIQRHLGDRAVPVLAQLATEDRRSWLWKKAAATLRQSGAFDRLEAVTRHLVALREAERCSDRKPIVQELRRLRDARALPALRKLRSSGGCGFLGLGNCNDCMQTELGDAIHELEETGATGP